MQLANTGLGTVGGYMLRRLRCGIEHDRSEETAGVTGSLLSYGSVAGVALMGQASGVCSFFEQLDWTHRVEPVYGASTTAHMSLNHALF